MSELRKAFLILVSIIMLGACVILSAQQQAGEAPHWEWNTDGQAEGWGREHNLTFPTISDGLLHLQLTGVDPWIVGPEIAVDAERYQFLALRIRVNHFGSGAIYWTTVEQPQFSQDRMVQFRLTSDTEFSELLLDLRNHPEWKGTITRLRLDPIDLYPTAVNGQAVEVDYLRFVTNAERPPEVRLGRLQGPRTLVVKPRKPFELRLRIQNTGGQAAEGLQVTLDLPPGRAVVRPTGELPTALAPDEDVLLSWSVIPRRVGPLPAAVTVRFANHPPLYAALRTLVLPRDVPQRPKTVSICGIRIVAPHYDFGWGPVFFQAEHNRNAPPCLLPSAGALFYVDADNTLRSCELVGEVPLAVIVDETDKPRALQFAIRAELTSGTKLLGTLRIAETRLRGVLAIRHELRASQTLHVVAFWGPAIYMGEPGAQTGKQDAIFPGLEWLVGEEYSSSDLDCTGPERIRYVPHPNKVTVPAMAVRTNGTLTGLLWDPRQEWASGYDRSSAVFAVPNTLEQRDDHLLALMAPSVPSFISENQTLASRPFSLEPGDKLSLEGYLVCHPADSSADIVLDWIRLFGLPPPEKSPHPRPLAAFKFTLNGYLNALWVPEENGWLNGYGPPAKVGPHWPFMRDMTIASRILPAAGMRQQVLEQLGRARGDVQGGFGVETAVYDGGLIPFVNQRWRRQVERLVTTQDGTGGWGFSPPASRPGSQRDPRILGEPGQVEVGTCASKARTLLQFARIAQDDQALRAGLRALARMKDFEVPRAAQIWEVPVHTPDVVAAAQAVRAYLEGYRATQDDQWLREAVRWALRGLPFIYLWDSGEYPYMQYGSIPVFGASWFTGAWFGRIVQWNGSEYAGALLELAPYDNSLPWRRIAEGIVASAALQQSQSGPTKGLYPDSCDLTNGSTSDFYVAPYHHCEALLALMGIPVNPTTALVSVGDQRVAITIAGEISETSHDAVARSLSFACVFPDAGRHHVLVANSPDIVGVTINGKSCSQQKDLLQTDGSAWCYDRKARMAEVRVNKGRRARIKLRLAE